MSGNLYQGDLRGGRGNGRGRYISEEGLVFIGEFEDDIPHGQVICLYKNGDRHEGEYKKGQKEGHGVYTKPDGYRYEGYITSTKDLSVKGKETRQDGTIYEGIFVNGLYHGQGVLNLADGTKYEGNFLKGMRHNRGISTNNDGSTYEGDWKADKMHGHGFWKHAGTRVTKKLIWDEGKLVHESMLNLHS